MEGKLYAISRRGSTLDDVRYRSESIDQHATWASFSNIWRKKTANEKFESLFVNVWDECELIKTSALENVLELRQGEIQGNDWEVDWEKGNTRVIKWLSNSNW